VTAEASSEKQLIIPTYIKVQIIEAVAHSI